MSKLREANQHNYPLDGSSMIHRQEGWPDLIAVGPGELQKLPKRQRLPAQKRIAACHLERPLTGFVGTDGIFYVFDGSPLVAKVSPRGEVTSRVNWF